MLLLPAEPTIETDPEPYTDTLDLLHNLPDTLAEAMAEDGITGMELSGEIGIAQSTMSNYLRRATRPSLYTVECVLRWLAQRA